MKYHVAYKPTKMREIRGNLGKMWSSGEETKEQQGSFTSGTSSLGSLYLWCFATCMWNAMSIVLLSPVPK